MSVSMETAWVPVIFPKLLFQTPDRFTAPQSLFCRDHQHVSDGLNHLPKALNRETISCRLSWNGGRWMLDAGRASICRPENKIFSAVPNPWVCPERDQNRAINHSGIKQTKFWGVRIDDKICREAEINKGCFYSLQNNRLAESELLFTGKAWHDTLCWNLRNAYKTNLDPKSRRLLNLKWSEVTIKFDWIGFSILNYQNNFRVSMIYCKLFS